MRILDQKDLENDFVQTAKKLINLAGILTKVYSDGKLIIDITFDIKGSDKEVLDRITNKLDEEIEYDFINESSFTH